jgi:hypothetical protein
MNANQSFALIFIPIHLLIWYIFINILKQELDHSKNYNYVCIWIIYILWMVCNILWMVKNAYAN